MATRPLDHDCPAIQLTVSLPSGPSCLADSKVPWDSKRPRTS